MHFTKTDIEQLNRIYRLNLINSVTGIKPANLIGTRSEDGQSNLAIFSSLVHLGSSPALIGFILRPDKEVRRHTWENIEETGQYTINHIHQEFVRNAHYTSAKFDKSVSEFEACNLTEEYKPDFHAPFVKESHIKMGMQYIESIPIAINDTLLVIGSIEHLYLPEQSISQEGYLDLSSVDDVGISGLNNYYSLTRLSQYPYARVHELPDFNQ